MKGKDLHSCSARRLRPPDLVVATHPGCIAVVRVGAALTVNGWPVARAALTTAQEHECGMRAVLVVWKQVHGGPPGLRCSPPGLRHRWGSDDY